MATVGESVFYISIDYYARQPGISMLASFVDLYTLCDMFLFLYGEIPNKVGARPSYKVNGFKV